MSAGIPMRSRSQAGWAIRGLLFAASLSLAVAAWAREPRADPEADRLDAALQRLEGDPRLSMLAPAEMARVRDAIEALRASPGKAELRAHYLYLAERRLAVARAAAEALHAERRLAELDREHDRILLDAARRDAELSRMESEKLRLQSMTREEDAERARADAAEALILQESTAQDAEQARARAEQARRLAEAQAREAALAKREAELAVAAAESVRLQMQAGAPRTDGVREVMTLAGSAFAPNGATLGANAQAEVAAILEFVNADPAASIRIVGHTDDQGGANLNQVLSQRRADALRDALVQGGVEASRITAIGRGEDSPVASNSTAEGRAANRRVEVIVEPPR